MEESHSADRRVVLVPRDRETLKRWATDARNALRANRAKAILLLSEGRFTQADIATLCDTHKQTIANWRDRFLERGLPGLDGTTRG